ncbi:hypothetical protein [Neptuniibacter halophilus]|uniref:hypothetical protein n=1 Tax=Neptuniibacter halophilus TaxID=651666 RepID=UPI002572B799|nr:hypothetical protein [Neptuniibacter halophilus]
MIRVLVLLLLLLPKMALSEVIVNRSVQLDTVSQQYLLSIFSMRTRIWPDGQPVHVFILAPERNEHKTFVKQELGIFPYKLLNIWDRALFSGSGQSPVVVETETEMLQRVAATQGAIGYMSSNEGGGPDVKSLRVD